MSDDGQRLYEGLFLLDPVFANQDEDGAIGQCQSILEKYGATVVKAQLWKEQKLSYEIRKNKRGAYILTAFRADPLKIAEIERECRITERVMRYLFLEREGVPMEQWFRTYDEKPAREKAESNA